jgi:hypothetical protein
VAVKADWHFDIQKLQTEQDEELYDPLTDASYMPPIPPIDLGTPLPQLHEHLKNLIAQEGELDGQGVTCPIKWKPDTTCLACPVAEHRDPHSPKGRLCRIGQEQERVLTVIAAQQADLQP